MPKTSMKQMKYGQCLKESRRTTYVKVKCELCGKTKEVRPTDFRKHQKRQQQFWFCDRQCKQQYLNKKLIPALKEENKIIINCMICKKKMALSPCQKNVRCCSRKCSGILQRTRRRIKCSYCGREHWRIPALIYKTNFCSKDCQNKYHSDRMAQAGNPAWKGGIGNEPYSADFDEKRKAYVRQRDNHACQECKARNVILAVHHIDYDKKNSSLENLLSLCEPCHGRTRVNREYWTHRYRQLMVKRCLT